MLREPGVRAQPAVPHGAGAHRHPASQAPAGRHRLLLRADEVHHRGQGHAELRRRRRLQREVSERLLCSMFFSFLKCLTSVWIEITNSQRGFMLQRWWGTVGKGAKPVVFLFSERKRLNDIVFEKKPYSLSPFDKADREP